MPDEIQDEKALIVRQPIFTRNQDVWGYELVANETPSMSDGNEVISLADLVEAFQDTLSMLGNYQQEDQKIFLDIPEGLHLRGDNLPDGWEGCVFGIHQETAREPDCPKLADSLQSNGGTVSLEDGIEPQASFDSLVDKSDIVKISLAGKTPPEIVAIRRKYREFGGELLVTDVTSWEAFEGTRALGFSYFQGSFFAVAQVPEGMELPASAVAKLQLLRELSNPECEMDELASIIASDVSLSYRILKYINSASFGFKTKIKSIQQAVSMIGLKELRRWATVVVMTDLDSSPKGEELAYMALQRARFLSKLAESLKDFEHSSNTMFMLGLFSKLDALLSYPMDKALEDIPLDKDIKDGLCGTLNEFRDWIRLLEAVEVANWDIANDILGRYGACLPQAATQYMKAASWAAKQLPDMKK